MEIVEQRLSEQREIVRESQRIVTAHHQTEGAGFVVRRPFPSASLSFVDPFLLLDEMGPIEYQPGQAVGAPDHPHRGFETITYVLDGEIEHEDSAGHRGVVGAGGVQWMTAGAGIVHSEMPSKQVQRDGGRVHGFQVWANLPAGLKMSQPRYQELGPANIPVATTDDGLASVRIIAGEALGVTASINTVTPIVYQDWTLRPGARVQVQVPADHQVVLYVFAGAIEVGASKVSVADGQLSILGDGDWVGFSADQPARVLLLGGVPLREPVARYGPFVMNTEAELQQAFADYRSGRLGEITREARIG